MTDSDVLPTDRESLLVVMLDGATVGTVTQGRAGQFAMRYDEQWRAASDATPLSLSMPLAQQVHAGPVVRAFMEGLLPDNEHVLERWAREYQVSARNPFALLQHVGEDCAGAAQFVRPDRTDLLRAAGGGVEWLTEAELVDRLRVLRKDPSAWHLSRTGQFSLAGAQAKTALLHDPETDRWGQPWGATPTTHILKPAVVGFVDHDLNEHLCLAAARQLGLGAVASRVVSFGDERVIVVERYDRIPRDDGRIRRLHQEDVCQALGVPPASKYQNEGGPGPEQVIALLRRAIEPVSVAADGIRRFVDALAFNWIIGGTDAHAKNYSLLLSGGQVRLAPLYDLASALPYDDLYAPKLRMAMKIGGQYRVEGVAARHWTRFSEANGLDPDETVAQVRALAARVPEAFARVAADPGVRMLDSRLPNLLAEVIARRARRCQSVL